MVDVISYRLEDPAIGISHIHYNHELDEVSDVKCILGENKQKYITFYIVNDFAIPPLFAIVNPYPFLR